MNRRHFLGVAALATLVPTWLHHRPMPINLKAFCRDDCIPWRYDMTEPFVQLVKDRPFTFATDARVCLRVAGNQTPEGDPDRNAPPANGLPFPDRRSSGWKPWPVQHHELTRDEECPTCNGEGFRCRICGKSSDPDEFCEHLLEAYESNKNECRTCKGYGFGVFPGVQRVGGMFISSRYDSLARKHLPGLEYRDDPKLFEGNKHYNGTALALRFEGGEGLLMSLVKDVTEHRLIKA